MKELAEIIHAEIGASGSIPFERFMELALYHPEYGYYRCKKARPRLGREGDFFTSVSVGPLFGRLLGRQFLQMWEVLGKPDPFWIIEQGAEDTQLACDLLTWAREHVPAFFHAIRYAVIEEHEVTRSRQNEKILTEGFAEKFVWFKNISDFEGHEAEGVFFSNELVDAFPVSVIRRVDGCWRELQVTRGEEGDFIWVDKPINDGELAEAIRTLPLPVIEGYRTEINLPARRWMADVGRIFKRGYVLTIDYGFPASVYYEAFRVNGTLTAYLEHRRTGEVLVDPGSRDITAHVDFTTLAKEGEKAGLATLGFSDQQHFLMGVAHDELSEAGGPRTGIAENVRAWNTLTHPNHLGTRFQVLLQAQDAPHDLDGLRYSRSDGLV